jgi:hypothetical protein
LFLRQVNLSLGVHHVPHVEPAASEGNGCAWPLFTYSGGNLNYGAKILNDMDSFLRLFSPHCNDRSSIDELRKMIGNEDLWQNAHDLFRRIRHKTLRANAAGNRSLECQYLFEEVCAQTLYNLSNKPAPAPFDADSPYWIIPNALSLARCVGIPDAEIIRVIAD